MKSVLLIILLMITSCQAEYKMDEKKVSYQNKNLEVILTNLEEYKYSIIVYKNREIIYKDVLFSKIGELEFKDFNRDGIQDILINFTYDVRSNEMFYLFLVNDKGIQKIQGFENIKNPKYNVEHNLVESYVVSALPYLQFYKIIDNQVYENDRLIVYDKQNEDRQYELDRSKTLKLLDSIPKSNWKKISNNNHK